MNTEKQTEKLETLVTTVASRLTPVDAVSFKPVATRVLQDLVEHFEVDTSFLRFTDHEIAATVLVAEYPLRPFIPPDPPDPLGVVYFKDADSTFAQIEHQKEVAIFGRRCPVRITTSGFARRPGCRRCRSRPFRCCPVTRRRARSDSSSSATATGRSGGRRPQGDRRPARPGPGAHRRGGAVALLRRPRFPHRTQ